MRRLVVAERELRWLGGACCVAGCLILGADLFSNSVGKLTALEAAASGLVFGLSVGAAVGGLVLGVRTGPAILYRRIFDRAPSPPAGVGGESRRTTALRAVGAALAGAVGLTIAAAFAIAAALVLLGKPKRELFDHLPEITALVAASWMLVFGAVALRVAEWVARWERLNAMVLVCPPLHSGLLRPVYYAAARAD